MSPRSPSLTLASWRFPRVSGDEPIQETAWAEHEAFSPRERG